MPERHLGKPRFTCSACRPFTKNKEIIRKFKETGNSRYIFQNELDKVCFQHDMAYEDFKYSPSGTASDKVLRQKAFNFPKSARYDGCRRDLTSMVYNFFDKKTAPGGAVKSEIVQNKELAE